MKTAGIVIAAVLGFALLIGGVFAFRWFTAEPRGALDAREQVLADGDFRIAAYNHFFGLCSSVQAQEDREVSLTTELETSPSESRRSQIQASLTAVRSQRAELIRTYNADAAKDYTSGQFRDADLPYQLDIDNKETQCVA